MAAVDTPVKRRRYCAACGDPIEGVSNWCSRRCALEDEGMALLDERGLDDEAPF